MVEYIEKLVALSPSQVRKLAKGKKVRLTNAALSSGQNKVFLTPQQLKKVETRIKRGVGAVIGPFDQAQIMHHGQHGGSIWSSLKDAGFYVYDNAIKPGARLVYNEVAKPLLKELKDEGIKMAVSEGRNRISDYFGKRNKGRGVGAKKGGKSVHKLLPIAHAQSGEGFFDDIGDFFTKTVPSVVKTTYNDVLKPAGQVILPIAKDLGKVAWDERDTLIPIAVEMAKSGSGAKRSVKKPYMIGAKYRKNPVMATGQVGRSFRLP